MLPLLLAWAGAGEPAQISVLVFRHARSLSLLRVAPFIKGRVQHNIDSSADALGSFFK